MVLSTGAAHTLAVNDNGNGNVAVWLMNGLQVQQAGVLGQVPVSWSVVATGDFEGNVSYGLGIQTAPNSDQVLRIRSGELKRHDNAGGFFYVVHFDVQSG